MVTRWKTNSLRAIDAFPAIKALAIIRTHALAIDAIVAYSKAALVFLPPLFKCALIRLITVAMCTPRYQMRFPIGKADCLVAVDTSPAFEALATLPQHLVILRKTLIEMLLTIRRYIFVSKYFGVKEFVFFVFQATGA